MMRHTLLMSASTFSLALSLGLAASLGFGSIALADTTISTATATPVSTSSTSNLTVSSGGTITLTSGTAVTVDSDSTVNIAGKLDLSKSADNSTGILINGGRTSSITLSGSILSTDDFTASDTGSLVSGAPSTTKDGIIDAPYAQGTGRIGIHALSATPFIGNVDLQQGSVIDIESNSGFGVRFENNITGTFNSRATFTQTGDNSTAISLQDISGNTRIGGAITVSGAGSSAINLGGDIGGALILDGSIVNTGYTTNASSLTAAQRAALLPSDMQQAGSSVVISGNVAHGILLDIIPTASTTNTDVDGDGLPDSAQGTSSISQRGSAPAVILGSATRDITIGTIQFAVTPDSTSKVNSWGNGGLYGLVERGSLSASGEFTGIESTGLQIGGLGHNVSLANGILVNGTISATALNADTHAVQLLPGAIVPALEVSGTVSATTSDQTTTDTKTARSVDIATGANLSRIQIDGGGVINSTAAGSYGNATAIRDQSNTLTSLTVNGTLSAVISATDANNDGTIDTVVNHAIALDTSSNSAGVTLTTNREITGTYASPAIIGDIKLGSGNDTITLNGGTITGDIDFGGGTNSLILKSVTTIPTSSSVTATTSVGAIAGKLTGSGTVALDIAAGSLYMTAGSKLNTTTVHVGSTSTLYLGLNTATPSIPMLNGSGALTFDNGALLKLGLSSLLLTPTQFTIATGSSISIGTLNTDLSGDVPYLYTATISSDPTHLYANFRLKTSAEAKLSSNEFDALPAVLTASQSDSTAQAALLTPTDRASFLKIYEQFLPDFSGEAILSLTKGSESLARGLYQQDHMPDPGVNQYWAQEYGFNVKRSHGDVAGFKADGFNFAIGVERSLSATQAGGIYGSVISTSPLDNYATGKETYSTGDVNAGIYWRLNDGPLKAWARAGAGYVSFFSTRQILSSAVDHTTKASWKGTSVAASLGAAYRISAGPVVLTPQIFGDAYSLSEDGRKEHGGGAAYDLTIAKRDSHIVSTRALLDISPNTNWLIKPEVWIGYQDNLSVNIAPTTAHFTGGSDFTLNSSLKQGGGPVAGFRLSSNNQFSYLGFEGEYEKQDGYQNVSLSFRARFQF